MAKKWFKPKRESGFSKDKTIEANLRTMHANTPKNMKRESRWRRVGRQAQALANVTQDKETQKKAEAVAERAFKKLKK